VRVVVDDDVRTSLDRSVGQTFDILRRRALVLFAAVYLDDSDICCPVRLTDSPRYPFFCRLCDPYTAGEGQRLGLAVYHLCERVFAVFVPVGGPVNFVARARYRRARDHAYHQALFLEVCGFPSRFTRITRA